MSSESLTGARFDDLQCRRFPVSGSLKCCTSVEDGESVWRRSYEEVKAIPITSHWTYLNFYSSVIKFPITATSVLPLTCFIV